VANNFIHAKLSTVQISSQYFAALTLDYNEDLSDLSDITYTQVGGATWRILLPGYNMASGTLSFVYDTLNQPVLTPFNMSPGTLINTFSISPDGTKLYTMAIYSAGLAWTGGPQQKGPVMVRVPWQSTGTVTRPAS
jgi:hypothetical protein